MDSTLIQKLKYQPKSNQTRKDETPTLKVTCVFKYKLKYKEIEAWIFKENSEIRAWTFGENKKSQPDFWEKIKKVLRKFQPHFGKILRKPSLS